MNFGQRLKKAREYAKLSQKALEERSGVSQKTISKIERGDQDGSTQIVQLAKACGVRAEWLASSDGRMVEDDSEPETTPTYSDLAPEAIEIARIWVKLPSERREWFRDLMSLEAIVATHYPWLMFGRPQRESYDQYEKRVERDILRLAARLQGIK